MSDCNPFGQGINIRPSSDVMIYTINQTQVFTSIPASTFSTTLSTCVFSFLLWVLRNSSSQPRRVLEFCVNTSWPWHPGASLLSGPKFELSPLSIVRSNRLARLNVESGISPLCLQIYFCTNKLIKPKKTVDLLSGLWLIILSLSVYIQYIYSQYRTQLSELSLEPVHLCLNPSKVLTFTCINLF